MRTCHGLCAAHLHFHKLDFLTDVCSAELFAQNWRGLGTYSNCCISSLQRQQEGRCCLWCSIREPPTDPPPNPLSVAVLIPRLCLLLIMRLEDQRLMGHVKTSALSKSRTQWPRLCSLPSLLCLQCVFWHPDAIWFVAIPLRGSWDAMKMCLTRHGMVHIERFCCWVGFWAS